MKFKEEYLGFVTDMSKVKRDNKTGVALSSV